MELKGERGNDIILYIDLELHARFRRLCSPSFTHSLLILCISALYNLTCFNLNAFLYFFSLFQLIMVPGYTQEEKMAISKQHLLPKQIKVSIISLN